MSCNVIHVDWRYKRRLMSMAVVRQVLRSCELARFLGRPDHAPETKARHGGSECEQVHVRNELKLWPKPGIMC